MKIPIKISVDYTLDFFDLARWHKRAGDRVRKGEVVLTFETQKESTDKAADADGVLVKIVTLEGEQVTRPVEVAHGAWGATVGYIETDEAQLRNKEIEGEILHVAATPQKMVPDTIINCAIINKPRQKVRAQMRPILETLEEVRTRPSPTNSLVRASAHVRVVAAEKGVALDTISPSGIEGTITLEDIECHKISTPLKDMADEFELVPLTARRKGIAHNLTKSWQEIPHAGSEVVVDFTNIGRRRKELQLIYADDPAYAKVVSRWDVFLIMGITRNLRDKWKIINSTFAWSGIKIHRHINMGISLADKHGLIVPVLQNIESLDHISIALALDNLYRGIEANLLTARNYRGATCTFNNPGVLGSHNGSSIIPWGGGSAIISLNAIGTDYRTVLGIRFDHRAYDGAEALGFLVDVKKSLEHPLEDV